MPTYNFEKVSVKAQKKIKCKKCGKSTQETRVFSQTINPFNKNKDGTIKTYIQIMDEEVKKRIDAIWDDLGIDN